MAKSYYAILVISSMATYDEVRTAYRRLAKTYHPDRYHGDSENFRQIQEAYSVLGNAERRRQYERQIHRVPISRYATPASRAAPEPLISRSHSGQAEAITPVHAYETLAPSTDRLFDMMWSNFASLVSSTSRRVRTLTMEVPLTPEQARDGGTVHLLVPAEARCPACQGDGGIWGYACRRCAGEGFIAGEMPVAIDIPPNIPDNYEILIPLDRYGIHNHQVSVILRITGC